ncbi:DUF2589 domain-containing protein [Pectobacterium betavasculorum]|uniref:DUF2589 domain-containing protein n=1 Tax=Pectobacterium betavasculorum TaxID=55207 RepID=A0ABR4UZM8_9GAMM|nr:DUF2589 domain-containing protein [Pectobacterium betavasculorum]KFX20303.1 hypothetical protein JV35_09345 [Pectobacterium betavasculorum]
MDSKFIASVINELPLENMISGPLQAMINAQVQASKAYTDFLLSVCIQNNKAVAIQFDYDETLIDESGVAKGMVTKTMRIPLIAAITHPIISIEEGTIDFELEVTQSESLSDDTGEDGNLAASLGWGAFKVKMAGRVSHKSTQTRTTDTRAKYSIHTQVKRQAAPEALMRVIDFLTDAVTRPSVLGGEMTSQTVENAIPTAPIEQQEASS